MLDLLRRLLLYWLYLLIRLEDRWHCGEFFRRAETVFVDRRIEPYEIKGLLAIVGESAQLADDLIVTQEGTPSYGLFVF